MDTIFSSNLTKVLLIFLTLCCRVEAVCENLTVYSGNEMFDANSSVCIKQYITSDCNNFALSLNQSYLPEDFPKSEQSVEKPSEINIIGTSFEFENSLFPGMSVKWKSPNSETARRNCIGYLLVWYRNSTVKSCRLFQLNQTHPVFGKELQYQYDIRSLRQAYVYTVEVYSMPCCGQKGFAKNSLVTLYVQTPPALQLVNSQVMPFNWSSFIAYQTFDNGTINVKFSLPSHSMNLTKFAVFIINQSGQSLFKNESYRPQYSDEDPQGSLTYSVRESGCFVFKLWPREEDELHDVEGRCSCWRFINDERTCENTCTSSSTSFCLNVTNPPSPDIPWSNTTVVSDETVTDIAGQDNAEVLIGAVIGGILFLSVILFVYIIGKYCTVKSWMYKWWKSLYCKPKPGLFQKPERLSGEFTSVLCLEPLTKKTVYIMYADDHQFHTQLVEAFTTFLEVHCHCRVITPSHFKNSDLAVYEWLIQSITTSDYIIFLNSEGAENLILAYLKNKNYNVRSPTLEEEIFRYGFKYLMKNDEAREENLIFVSFQGKHCQKYLQASENYTLLEHLPFLLQKIHGLNSKIIKAYDKSLPIQVENIPNLPEGSRLIFAIKAVQDYEETNPDWFKNSFGTLNLLSNDTGYSTALSSCIGSVSTQDLTLSETNSPVSVFGQPNYAKYIHTELTRLRETNTFTHSENLDEESVLNSCFTVYSPEFNDLTRGTKNELEQKPGSSDVVSILPPKSLTGIVSNFTEAFAQINSDEESTQNDEIKHEPRPFDEVSIVPPKSLSGTVFSDFSEAIAKINNNEESDQTDKIKHEPVSFDEVSIVPPQSLTGTVFSNFSETFAEINSSEEFIAASTVTNNEVNNIYPDIDVTKCIYLTPPDTISDLQVDNVNSALQDINARTENTFFRRDTLVV